MKSPRRGPKSARTWSRSTTLNSDPRGDAGDATGDCMYGFNTSSMVRTVALLGLVMLGTLVSAGCASTPELMPTPNLYAWSKSDPFADVPPALQNNHVEVLYYTD